MTQSSPPSTVLPGRGRRPAVRLIAGLVATAVATFGLTAVGAVPAQAAGPSVSIPAVPASGGTVTVTGSGFSAAAPGVYLGLGPAGLPGFYPGSADLISSETVWIGPGNVEGTTPTGRTAPLNSDGTFSVTVTVPATTAAVPAYAVYTSKAHGQGMTDTSQNTTTAVTFAAPDPTATSLVLAADRTSVSEGDDIRLTATVSPAAAGTVRFLAGTTELGSVPVTGATAELTTTLGVGSHSVTAAFTPTDATAFGPATAAPVSIVVTASGAPAAPSVAVSPATGLDPAGASLTVTGSAFTPTGGGVPGVYVAVGPKSVLTDPAWFANASSFQGTAWVRTIGSGGAFTSTLTGLTASFTSNGSLIDCLAVECGVFTFAAHGSADRSQDTYTPIAFQAPAVAPAATSLRLETAASTSTEGAGIDVTVTVTPIAAGTVTVLDRTTVVARDLPLKNGVAKTRLTNLSAGERSLSATFTPADPTAFAPSAAPSVPHTVTPAPITVVPTPESPAVAVDAPTEQVCVARSVGGADLDWGLKSSFRTYITGGIANGSWSLSGVGYEGGRFHWDGGSGSYNTADDKGTVRFPGSVSFTGHNGVLNLVISNVAVRVESASSATLIADVHATDMDGAASDHAGVSFASIALGGSGASGSALTATDAPVTLTAAGAAAFAGFYEAGTALDPVSFRLPFGATVPCDSTTATGLATTGGGDTGGWPLIGGLLILVGVAAVVAVRRRTSSVVPAAGATAQ